MASVGFGTADPPGSTALPAAPRFAWYGDDFTGATDTLAVLAQAGLRAMLFLGVPNNTALAAAGPLDAVGLAGAARAMAPAAMHAELTEAGRFFQTLAPRVLHYKVCSTFDSSPAVGSIGCAVQALHPFVEHRWVPIVGGQPSLGRYCAFSNLFAAAGTGGTVHRIDRHPTMRQHPVTPMGEADLRLHLGRQGLAPVGALHYPQYATSPDQLDAALQSLLDAAAPGPTPTLLDLTDAGQLATLGRLVWQRALQQRLLAVGSSAVAQALVAHWAQARDGLAEPAALSAAFSAAMPPAPPPTTSAPLSGRSGSVFAFAGSLSPLTARQVQAATSYQQIALDAQRLATDPAYAASLVTAITAQLQAGAHVLAYTAPDDGKATHSAVAEVAQASTRLIADVVQTRIDQGRPLTRIGIAGGDTSSHAALALQLWGLSYAGSLCPGVTMSRAHSQDAARDGLLLMLKGGQMGGDDVFERLLAFG